MSPGIVRFEIIWLSDRLDESHCSPLEEQSRLNSLHEEHVYA